MLPDAGNKRRHDTPLEQPVESLDTETQAVAPAIGWRSTFKLVHSAAVASFWIHRLSLSDIEGRARRMRPTALSDVALCNAANLRDVVSSCMRMRAFLFTAHDKFLHDSLTLVHFLAKQGLFARWVVEVRTRPFAAHSWVQSGHLVLKTCLQNARVCRTETACLMGENRLIGAGTAGELQVRGSVRFSDVASYGSTRLGLHAMGCAELSGARHEID